MNEGNPGTLFIDDRREIMILGGKIKKAKALKKKCFRKIEVCFICAYRSKPHFLTGSLKSELLPKSLLKSGSFFSYCNIWQRQFKEEIRFSGNFSKIYANRVSRDWNYDALSSLHVLAPYQK